jgi:alpha-1,6-mannosyltransferase
MATSWFAGDHFNDILEVSRTISAVVLIAIIAVVWWRYRKTERDAVMGIVIVMVAIVVLSPAALPWYYSWPLAVAAGFAMSPTTLAVLTGLSTWLMLVFQPDGSIGLYTFPHVALAIVAAVIAAMSLQTEDPLRLRGRKHEKPIEMTSAASAPSTSGSA